jgi:hypothetical protein
VLVSFSVLFVDSSGLLYRIESIDQNRRAIWNKSKRVERADQNARHHESARRQQDNSLCKRGTVWRGSVPARSDQLHA